MFKVMLIPTAKIKKINIVDKSWIIKLELENKKLKNI